MVPEDMREPLYVAFIDLTEVSRDGLFKILAKIGCPPILLSIMKSFHDDMKGQFCTMVPLPTPSTSLVA